MDIKGLIDLSKHGDLTLDQLTERHPEASEIVLGNAVATVETTVKTLFAGGSPALRKAVARLGFSAEALAGDAKIADLAMDGLKRLRVPQPLLDEARKILDGQRVPAPPDTKQPLRTPPETVTDVVSKETPIASQPAIAHLRQLGDSLRMGQALGVAQRALGALADKTIDLASVDRDHAEALVDDGVLRRRDVEAVAQAGQISRLLDRRPEIAERAAALDVRRSSDLLRLSVDQWTQVAEETGAAKELGLEPRAYGELLRGRAEVAHPARALAARIQPQRRQLATQVDTLKPLLERDGRVLAKAELDDEDLEGFDRRARRRLIAAHQTMRRLVGRFPGLGLEEILDGSDDADDRAAKAFDLAEAGRTFLERNEDVLSTDLVGGSESLEKLDFDGADADTRQRLMRFAQGYQRLLTVAETPEVTEKVAAAGYRSALSIARSGPRRFRETTGLSEAHADLVYANAVELAPAVIGSLGSVLERHRDWFARLPVGNLPVGVDDVLKELPGYEDFFGSQDYCACEDCRSVLGPAAYFVDLMEFVDQSISQPTFARSRSQHPLALRQRRPDLWTLPLTCENTNSLIPTLLIVAEILETFIASDRGFGGDLSDRAAIGRFVYRDTLPTAIDSFAQPFVLPIHELQIFLGHYSLSLADIGELTRRERARSWLGLSREAFDEIVTPRTTLPRLRAIYGVSFQQTGGSIRPVDAQALLRRTGLDRDALGHAVETRFVTRDGTDDITIRGEKRSAESVQNDIERITGLTRRALDRLRRMTLLTRALGWSHDELDVALERLAANELEVGTVATVCRIDRLRRRVGLSVEEALAWVAPIATRATRHEGVALADRLFNPAPYDDEPSWPNAGIRVLLPAFAPDGQDRDPNLERLLAGLRLDDEGLTQLVGGLVGPLGIDPEAADLDDRRFALTLDNLSRLHRAATLARELGTSPGELHRLVALTPEIAGSEIAGIADVEAVVAFATWLDDSRWDLDEIEWLVGGSAAEPSTVPDGAELAEQLIDSITAEDVLRFGSHVLTVLDGVSDAASRAILDANPMVFEATDDQYRLTADHDPDAALVLPADDVDAGVVLPAALRADPEPIRSVLDAFRVETLIGVRAPELLESHADAFATAVELLGLDLADPEIRRAVRGDDPPAALVKLLERVAPLASLFADEVLDADRLDFIAAETGTLFAITDPRALSVDSIRRVDAYADAWRRVDRFDSEPDLDALLRAFDPATGYATAADGGLAAVLDCEPTLAEALHDAIDLEPEAFAALDRLVAGLEMARRLSVGGTALARMTSDDYDELAAASSALQAGLRAKYVDDEEWQDKVEPYRDRVLSVRRDGLAAFLLHSSAPELDSIEDLYRYFLIDAQLEGYARTSRVVSANSTLQLYVQRVSMNLEETPPGHADPVHVEPSLIDQDEWSWRKNYRVWEANRRVFLFPENYLLPELRDNKTPLFEQLEETLASQDVNSETVRDAYAAYLRGFEEVSRLQIAGAHHEKDTDAKRDVLHLFGVTTDDPPVHYYRRVDNLTYGLTEPGRATDWGAWRELDAKIPARKVSPIVHQGRLFVFWVEVATTPRQKIADGSAEFDGYSHKFKLHFITRKLDGTWTTPQTVRLEGDPFHFGDGVVIDEKYSNSVYYSNAIHTEAKDGYTLRGFPWERVYPSHVDRAAENLVIRGFDYQMSARLDLYELRMGETITTNDNVWVPWISPTTAFWMMLLGGRVGFPSSRCLWSHEVDDRRVLRRGQPGLPFCNNYAFGSLVLQKEQYEAVSRNRGGYNYMMHGPTPSTVLDGWRSELTTRLDDVFDGPRLIEFHDATPGLSVISGAENHGLIDVEGALFVLLDGLRGDQRYHLQRLNSSLAEDIARTLFTRGVDEMLDIETQEALAEHPLDFDVVHRLVADDTHTGDVDYDGPAGVYLREIYFHVPVAIAQQLGRQGDYEAARDWYHYIFDPTASDVIDGIDRGLSERDQRRRALDRNWRYREFRGRKVDSLRDMLENEAAVETYKNDPFNPHAIARLRLAAYQKWVVLAYVDNLLDWADSLFATDLREQIGEATLLYVTALDILGDRPDELGGCGERIGEGLTYAQLASQIDGDPDLLLEIESLHVGRRFRRAGGSVRHAAAAVDSHEVTRLAARAARANGVELTIRGEAVAGVGADARSGGRSVESLVAGAAAARPGTRAAHEGDVRLADALRPGERRSTRGVWHRDNALGARRARATGAATNKAPGRLVGDRSRFAERYGLRRARGVRGARGTIGWITSFGASITRQIRPVFCIPENDQLGKYWDRVEDRLFKIRNCMNIDGVRRPLALFSPPIDPLLLVRARAAGLSIADVIGAGASELPPFRFRFLIERARAATAMTQALGSALSGALERKDAEELALLRNTHQANVLKLSQGLKELEIDIAEQGVEQILARREVIAARRDHFRDLLSEGNTGAENVRTVSKAIGMALKTGGSVMDILASINHLIPQIGAPTAMKWGGKELGDCFTDISRGLRAGGEIADTVAAVAGIVADYERRAQGWAHQIAMAEKEIDALEPQEEGARLRLNLAQRLLSLHEQSIRQHDEISEFFDDKFTGLGHYNYLASTLQQLYRAAYNIALGYSRLAEVAYRFETDDNSFLIAGGDYWTASRAGLLAGEKLNLDLMTLEKRYIEGRRRSLEINQSFSLMQIDPAALLQLKRDGGCNFTLPEFYFDLFYPGQYKRRIRSVRVTIPCIAGPYVNISGTLALTESFIRHEADATVPLVAAPRSRDAMIATSTAQADAGVFELNFRDERYLPFEGAGAVSSWRLDLPTQFRPFDYGSISDVILNISYTADYDFGLRAEVENAAADIDGTLANILANTTQTRIFSLRQEFSAAFQRLVGGAVGSEVDFEITELHFPLYLRGHAPSVTRTTVLLETADGLATPNARFTLDSREATGFVVDPDYGGLQATSVANGFADGLFGRHTLRVDDAGSLAPDEGTAALDRETARDLLIAVDYTVG